MHSADCFSACGRFLLISKPSRLEIHDFENPNKPRKCIPILYAATEGNVHFPVCWNPHRSHVHLAAVGVGGLLSVWNTSLGSRHSLIQAVESAHLRPISCMQWSPQNTYTIATGSTDSFIHIWDIRSPVISQSFSVWNYGISALGWSPKDGYRLAAVADNQLFLWDQRFIGSTPMAVATDESRIVGWDWSPTCTSDLLTYTDDNQLKVWSLGADCQPHLIKTWLPTGALTDAIFSGIEDKTILISHGSQRSRISSWRYSSSVEGNAELMRDLSAPTTHRLIRRPCLESNPVTKQIIAFNDWAQYTVWDYENGRLARNPLRKLPLTILENVSFVSELYSSAKQFGMDILLKKTSKIMIKGTFGNSAAKYPRHSFSSVLKIDHSNLSLESLFSSAIPLSQANFILSKLNDSASSIVADKDLSSAIKEFLAIIVPTIEETIFSNQSTKELAAREALNLFSEELDSEFAFKRAVLHSFIDRVPFPRLCGGVFNNRGVLVTFYARLHRRGADINNTPRAYEDYPKFKNNLLGSGKDSKEDQDKNKPPGTSERIFIGTPKINAFQAPKQSASAVTLTNISPQIMLLNFDLGKKYRLSGSLLEVCNENLLVARQAGRSDLIETWKYIRLIVASMDANFWGGHPFGRGLAEKIFSYYESLMDLQSLAMFSFIFERIKSADESEVYSKKTPNSQNSLKSVVTEARIRPSLKYADPVDGTPATSPRAIPRNNFQLLADGYTRGLISEEWTRKLIAYRHAYSYILLSWEMNARRAELLKFDGELRECHQDQLKVLPICRECFSELQGNACVNCRRVANLCTVCRRPLKAVALFCQLCGHGGHSEHITEWFKQNPDAECPSGCGCLCLSVNGGKFG